MSLDLVALGRRLYERAPGRSEADLKADVRTLLLYGGLSLDEGEVEDVALETATGSGFIDIEVGACVIEAKRSLVSPSVVAKARDQLARYVAERTADTGLRYVGVLTDGRDWTLYRLEGEAVLETAGFTLEVDGLGRLAAWLEGVLATARQVKPTPSVVVERLGAESPSYQLEKAELTNLYHAARAVPAVALKRELWGKLLKTALGTQFDDSDELFVEHTLLVLEAEAIAHAVLGIDIATLPPGQLAAGDQFRTAGVSGVVEHDFFDWPLEAGDGGSKFVSRLARRLARFDWGAVEHDLMKVLYEATIPAAKRKQLGEYYTPDWLAERMVDAAITDPLAQRAVDPACGSGTFLFHAVRRYLDAAEADGMTPRSALETVSEHVMGLDLHPVAVTLARVTYLLAIGTDRLAAVDRPPIMVPVYLGDSMQWTQQTNALTAGFLVVPTDDGYQLFADELRFPSELIDHTGRFDQLVARMADLAQRRPAGSAAPAIDAVLNAFGVPGEHRDDLRTTFAVMCRLHDENRDHIWGYYVRNLARPLWLSDPENQADVLIGNPPWLAHQHMPRDMQTTFKEMSRERSLVARGGRARAYDLAALFVARCIELYLKPNGRFAFVMPLSTLTRRQYEGFRAAHYTAIAHPVNVAFTEAWDLQVHPEPFPVPACVVCGIRSADARPFDGETVIFTGRIPAGNAAWNEVEGSVVVDDSSVVAASSDYLSPYEPRFRQGAIVVPRVLLSVEDAPVSGSLGVTAGMRRVRSRRSAQEKLPWKKVATLEGVVEASFVRPMLIGESLVAFRTRTPYTCVLPIVGQEIIGLGDARMASYAGLEEWWAKAEESWEKHRKRDAADIEAGSKSRSPLSDRLDYHGQLTAQLGSPQGAHRVLYTASAGRLVAARQTDPRAIVEHKLYWGQVWTEDEALYLVAVMNADKTADRVSPLQSKGKFGPRDIDKAVFLLPIPEYDPTDALHAELVKLAREGERVAEGVEIPEAARAQQARRLVLSALAEAGVTAQLNDATENLLAAHTAVGRGRQMKAPGAL